MSPRARRILAVLILLLLGLIALLLVRCNPSAPVATPDASTPAPGPAEPAKSDAPTRTPAPETPKDTAEVLSPATVKAPAEVVAGAAFDVEWTGPNNRDDYVTIVPASADDHAHAGYAETRLGTTLNLTAPIDAGACEVRYVAARSKTVLARAPITVTPAAASIEAPAEALLGSTIPVKWTGPNNEADYITIVPKGTPDGEYKNYTETRKGSPLQLELLPETGDAELRYMTGKGAKVLARRDIKLVKPETFVRGPEEVTAGKIFTATWAGPDNHGDYLTIVPQGTPDGRYHNYTETRKGSPLELTALMETGDAELRYMTGQGAKVLARQPIRIVAAQVTLDAPAEVVVGSAVPITWTGPDNRGDYLTIVPQGTRDGEYARYSDTSRGSPLTVEAPMDVGPAEIRYMSGQGAKVMARRAITTIPAKVTLKAAAKATPGTDVEIEWTGPNNRGDYLTIVAKSAQDGTSHQTTPTHRGSPAKVRAPAQSGPAEIRYMSGQGDRVLGRIDLELAGEVLAAGR